MVKIVSGADNAPWLDRYTEVLQIRDLVIFADYDARGIACAYIRAQALQGIASRIKVVLLPDLPTKGDVGDWLNAGHTKAELLANVRDMPRWTPDTVPECGDRAGEQLLRLQAEPVPYEVVLVGLGGLWRKVRLELIHHQESFHWLTGVARGARQPL